jgi:hypothetical protein
LPPILFHGNDAIPVLADCPTILAQGWFGFAGCSVGAVRRFRAAGLTLHRSPTFLQFFQSFAGSSLAFIYNAGAASNAAASGDKGGGAGRERRPEQGTDFRSGHYRFPGIFYLNCRQIYG